MSNPAKYDESTQRKYRKLFFFSLGLFGILLLLEFLLITLQTRGGVNFKIQPLMILLMMLLEFAAVPMMLVTGFTTQ